MGNGATVVTSRCRSGQPCHFPVRIAMVLIRGRLDHTRWVWRNGAHQPDGPLHVAELRRCRKAVSLQLQ